MFTTRRLLLLQQQRLSPAWLSSLPLSSLPIEKSTEARRSFHATQRQEILPLVAVGTLFFIGRYTWKALNRMDADWEEYQWQLQKYERQQKGANDATDSPPTIGIDLGSVYLKVSALSTNMPAAQQSSPEMTGRRRADLIATPQGDRYRFAGIISDDSTDTDESEDENTVITGRPALEKFFYELQENDTNEESNNVQTVQLPFLQMQLDATTSGDVSQTVRNVIRPVQNETLEQISDESSASTVSSTARTVVCLSPSTYDRYGGDVLQDDSDPIVMPDSVAAIWGAEAMGIIQAPDTLEDQNAKSTLVIDVGGLTTGISIVQQDKVMAFSELVGVGGETYVRQLMSWVVDQAEDETLRNDPVSLALIQTGVRSSVLELVQKNHVDVHIPYLFMGRRPEQPHLEASISRTVVERMVQDYWVEQVVPKLVEDELLASSLPTPTDTTTLVSSAVTKVLEDANETPMNIQHILLVGGGSKHLLVEKAVQEGLWTLMGPSPEKLALPEASMRSELVALGAANLLPNYTYSIDYGLERSQQ